MDAVREANSGHPGTPMGLAPLVYALWQRFLRFDPEDPIWPNRDRFVLSNGHATSVGMAIGQRWLATHFNRFDFAAFDYHVYAICGDGDMMEGVTSEAASLAGHLMLGNPCWMYDSNRITIEGHTDLASVAMYIAQVQPRDVVYIDNTAMFTEIAQGLGIRSVLHTDYQSTRAKLAALGLSSG
jgi:transketolase